MTNQLLYLSQAEVTAVNITMAEIIKAVEVAFREKGNGRDCQITTKAKPENMAAN